MRFLGLFIALSICSYSLNAQDKRFRVFKETSEERAALRNNMPVSFYYHNDNWNKDEKAIESGFAYLRDKETGQLTELRLTETKPNSGVFVIDLPIGTLQKSKISAEVYIPPQELLKEDKTVKKVHSLIVDNKISRKPFLLRVIRGRGQIMDVFDNKAEALKAYNDYRERMGLSPEAQESDSIVELSNSERTQKKKVIDTSTLQSLFLASDQNADESLRKQREERKRLIELERERRNLLLTEARNWAESLKKENRRQATDLVKLGVENLKEKKLEESVQNFLKASNLNPESEDLYQQYGVSLFRAQKHNQAIVILNLSEPSDTRLAEKYFYLGMSYYQLKDYEAAAQAFSKVKQAPSNQSFLATSSFYEGAAMVELREFDKARESFQFVLDNSQDPQMDQRAEKFIEYALDQEELDKRRSKWFFAEGTLGLMYDSNILLASDQVREQGEALDIEGWRLLTQLSTQFRPYYSETDELRIGLDITNLRSFNMGFGDNEDARRADPLLLGFNVPWTHRSTIGGKGYFFDLVPGYETIVMDLDGNGNEIINKSTKLDFNNTLIANKNMIAKADLFFSHNEANIVNLPDPSAADSVTVGARLSSIIIVNKDQERYLIPELSYRINDAKSADFAFNRVDLGLTLTSALYGKWMLNSRLGYFLANYESDRMDSNLNLSMGVSRRIHRNWNWGLMASYIVNDSNFNPFDKFNVVSTVSFSY